MSRDPAAFEAHRAHLLRVGYRITGRLTDAEDAVQEAWLRYAAQGTDPDDPLSAVVRHEDVRMAAMLVLERLSAPQRVAFVLQPSHEPRPTRCTRTSGPGCTRSPGTPPATAVRGGRLWRVVFLNHSVLGPSPPRDTADRGEGDARTAGRHAGSTHKQVERAAHPVSGCVVPFL